MRTTLLVLLLGLSYASKATYNTIALTGYNRDIVANGAVSALSSISPGMTGGFDSAGYALVAQDYNFGGYTPSYYLPTGGVLNSTLTPSLNFQLADYSANNALRLKNAGDTGLLTFGTPQVAGALYILGTTGSGDAMLDMAVHFSDGTSQLFTGITYPDWYSAGGSITGIGRVSTVDNHTEGTSADPSLYEYVLNLDPTNYAKLITGITITKTSADGIVAIMAVSASSICSGTPTAGSASASVTSGCSSFTTTLSLAGSSTESGISYQWQSSADGTNWTNIAGATASTYNANVSANTFFRAYMVCSVSGLADTSTNTEVTETGPSPVVATLPFNESFESWTPACYSFDRPGTNWLDSPPTGNASWRRDDQGSDASWDLVGSYMYTPTSTAGSHSARFHSGYAYPAGSAGNMDLYANLSAVGTKRISLDYTNASGSDYLTISLSEDGGSTFTTLGTYYTTSGWESEAVTTTSTAANAIIRVQGVSDYGSTDLGVDNFALVLLTPCTGTPAAGAISSSQLYGCSEFNAILSLPVTGITGLSYQWQSSADSATWTDVSGATSNTYTADVTTNIYYRVYVTCTASSLSDTSAGIHLLLVTPVATNATLPFFESFESWIGTCYMFDRPGSNWLQSPVTDNNSWRRDDQGSDAAWHNPDAYMYDPASTDGSRSARFHSGWAYPAGSIGNLDLHIDLSTPGTKLVRFDYNNLNGDDYLNLQLSEDGGSTFTTINTYSVTPSGWMAEIATLSSVAANAVLRFQAVSDYGGTDIGIDSLSVSVAPDCSGAPVAGTYTASQTSGCSAYSAALSVDAPLYMTGISYQWQSSPDGVSYTDVAGATNTSYTASITGNMYSRFYAACSFSGLADTSAAIELTETPEVAVVATLPYFQSFESWLGGCTSFDRRITAHL